MAALAAPGLVVAELVAEHVTRAPARPGALVVVAELAADLVAAPLDVVRAGRGERRRWYAGAAPPSRWWPRWSPSSPPACPARPLPVLVAELVVLAMVVVVAELAALHVGHVAQEHDTRRTMPGSR